MGGEGGADFADSVSVRENVRGPVLVLFLLSKSSCFLGMGVDTCLVGLVNVMGFLFVYLF